MVKIYTNIYYEEYARLSLQYLPSFNYNHFVCHDKPDLQNKVDNIGIEVTRLISFKEAEYESVIREIFGKNLTYDDIKDNKKLNSPKFMGRIYNINNVIANSYGKGLRNTDAYIIQCIECIKRKCQKMKTYKRFNKNGLYIFMETAIGIEYLTRAYQFIDELSQSFDFYIFNFIDTLQLYDLKSGQSSQFEVSKLNILKKEALMKEREKLNIHNIA